MGIEKGLRLSRRWRTRPRRGAHERASPEGVSMRPQASIDGVRAQAFEIPTDKPEADGTIDWNSTTLVLVQISGGGKTGIGYTYSSASIVRLICGKLASTIEGSDAFNPQACWLAMQRAVRNLGREGLVA